MTAPPPEGPKLHSFAGNAAPQPLVEGWRKLHDFSPEARSGLWNLLAPVILAPADPGNQQRFKAFQHDHQIDEADAVAAVQACGLLLRQASALDLDAEHLRQDLAALANGDADHHGGLLTKYEELKGPLRQQIINETLAMHGKVLVGLDWRVDNVVNSDRGARLNATVVFLTLRYRDGDRVEHITLQLTPEALKELKQFSERIGG